MEVLLTRRQSRRNLLLVGVTSATTAMEYGLLMPTVLEYMRDELHVTPELLARIAAKAGVSLSPGKEAPFYHRISITRS